MKPGDGVRVVAYATLWHYEGAWEKDDAKLNEEFSFTDEALDAFGIVIGKSDTMTGEPAARDHVWQVLVNDRVRWCARTNMRIVG